MRGTPGTVLKTIVFPPSDCRQCWDQAGLSGVTVHPILLARMDLDLAVSHLLKIPRDWALEGQSPRLTSAPQTQTPPPTALSFLLQLTPPPIGQKTREKTPLSPQPSLVGAVASCVLNSAEARMIDRSRGRGITGVDPKSQASAPSAPRPRGRRLMNGALRGHTGVAGAQLCTCWCAQG